MARHGSWTWTVIISLLLGAAGASVFWLYSPYGHDRLAQPAAEDSPPGLGPGGALNLKKLATQAMGARYQMVADGKQVFLVDLTNGRVWRYFRHTKEGGSGVEDEGFLPIGLYYAGQKHYTASEVAPPPGGPGTSPQTLSPGKQPQ